jgi:hypothetical protein
MKEQSGQKWCYRSRADTPQSRSQEAALHIQRTHTVQLEYSASDPPTLLKATMRGELKFIGAVTVPAPPSMDPRGDEICRNS